VVGCQLRAYLETSFESEKEACLSADRNFKVLKKYFFDGIAPPRLQKNAKSSS